MARITSQKAIEALGGNQFLLIKVASYRARQLSHGATPRVDPKDNKPGVIAIREIEEGKYTEEDYYNDINGITKDFLEGNEENEY